MGHGLKAVRPGTTRVVSVTGRAAGRIGITGLQSARVVNKTFGAAAGHQVRGDFGELVVIEMFVAAVWIILICYSRFGVASVSCCVSELIGSAFKIVRQILAVVRPKGLQNRAPVRVRNRLNSPAVCLAGVLGFMPVWVCDRCDESG